MFNHFSAYPDLGLLALTGKDACSFLHNQVSNDINNLPEQHACYATYNTPQGRVIGNFIVMKYDNQLLIVLPKPLIEKISKRLKLFVLRSDVQFEELSQERVFVQAPEKIEIIDRTNYYFPIEKQNHGILVHLPHHGKMFICNANDYDIKCTGDVELFKLHEIRQGYPWVLEDTTETCVAQMLNQHTLQAVHFKKGCYPGQEIIARAQYRGQVKRGMAYYICHSPILVGEKLLNEQEEDVGLILNIAKVNNEFHILAVIKHSAINMTLHTLNSVTLTPQNYFFSIENK
jgi:folate-binding protein YgfZ